MAFGHFLAALVLKYSVVYNVLYTCKFTTKEKQTNAILHGIW